MNETLLPLLQKSLPPSYGPVLVRLDDAALEAVLLAIIEAIPEKKLPEFEAALGLSNPRVLEAFLRHEVPGFDGIVKNTLGSIGKDAHEIGALLES
jgi:hypothetical protein